MTIYSYSGDDWKDIRSTFSPVFTSGKIKGMSRLIDDIASRWLLRAFDEACADGTEMDLKETFGKFSMDSIASCAFGLDAQSFSNRASKFVENARSVFRRNIWDALKLVPFFIPGGIPVLHALGISLFKMSETKFFYEIIKSTMERRIATKERRNDLVDSAIDAMKELSDQEESDG